jgi:predicted RNA-binding protein YlqC (UPF0109 family)
MNEWLENYVKSLVQFPDQVESSQKDGVQTHVITIKVANEDFDPFKGRNNRLARALSMVASLNGAKARKRFVVKFAV